MYKFHESARLLTVVKPSSRRLARSFGSAVEQGQVGLKLVLLARQESAVDAVTSLFAALGASNIHQVSGSIEGRSLYSSSSQLGPASIDVIADVTQRWAWPDRKGAPQEMLRVVAAGPWGSPAVTLPEEALLSLLDPSSSGSSSSSRRGSLWGRMSRSLRLAAAALPAPRVVRQQDAGGSSSSSAAPSSSPTSVSSPWSLKEVVLGCEGPGFSAAQAELEDCSGVVQRDRRNLSLWRIGGQGSTASAVQGQGIRLLPSRYSAVVLGQDARQQQAQAQAQVEREVDARQDMHDAQLQQAQEAIVAACAASASLGQQVRVREYGTRRGHGGSGQLLITAPFLHGLDLRVCGLPPGQHALFFSERHEAMSDHIDPDMNPGWDAPVSTHASTPGETIASQGQGQASVAATTAGEAGGQTSAATAGDERLATALAKKQKSLACNSVVGMEVVGMLKHKLGMQP